MARIRIYYHETCYSSFRLLTALEMENLLDRVELVRAGSPSVYSDGLLWSVPWITLDGKPVATDPVSIDDVKAILGMGSLVEKPYIQAFTEAILHSSYATSLSLLHGSLKPVIEEKFVSAALRAPIRGIDLSQAMEQLERSSEKLFGEIYDSMVKSAGIAFLRTLWWAHKGNLSDFPPDNIEVLVGFWLLSTASIGRVGLPRDPRKPKVEAAKRIAEFVESSWGRLVSRIESEQRLILESDLWDRVSKRYETRLETH